MRVFIDTSAWLAVADPAHEHHEAAAEYYVRLIRRGDSLVTSSNVLAEACAGFERHAGEEGAKRFRAAVGKARRQGLLQTVAVNSEIARRAWDIFERYNGRLTSFLHCTSFVIAGRLGIQDVFSFSDDFAAIGFRVWPQQGPNGEGRDLTR